MKGMIMGFNSEAYQQQKLFEWAATVLDKHPELKFMHHIPNGGARGSTAKERAIRGGQLKAQGVKKGAPDICLPVKRGEFSGLYIEMKKPSLEPKREGSKGGVSEEQADFIYFLESQGFKCSVCYTWESAANVIENYL